MSLMDNVESLPLEILGPASRHANLIFKQTGGLLEPDDMKAILVMLGLVVQIEMRASRRRGEPISDE